MRLPLKLLCLSLCLSSSIINARMGLDSNHIISENWRWRELELLRNNYIFCCSEDAENNLWFASDKALIKYDGYRAETILYPETLNHAKTYNIKITDTYIYITTTNGIYAYNGEWHDVNAYSRKLQNSKNIIETGPNQTLYCARNGGIGSIDGLKTNLEARLKGFPYDIRYDSKNENLWVTIRYKNRIIKIPIFKGKISPRIEWKTYKLGHEKNILWGIILDEDKNQIWVYNDDPQIPAFHYDSNSDRFEADELGELNQSYNHSDGIHLKNHGILLCSKADLLLYADSEWKNIDVDSKTFPWYETKFYQRKNGDLIVSGRGERTLLVEISDNRWRTYPKLNFQCETPNGSKWFISQNGSIIELKPNGQQYTWENPNIIDSPVTMICSKDGTLWISGSEAGVASISYRINGQWHMDKHPSMLKYFSYLSAREMKNGDIIFGSGTEIISEKGGYVRYYKNNEKYLSETTSPPDTPNNRIVGIAETLDGKQWYGGKGLILEDSEGCSQAFENKFSTTQWVDHISEDGMGNLWLAIWEKGVYCYNGTRWKNFTEPTFLNRKQSVYIQKDLRKQGALWIANRGGISYYDGQSWIPNALPHEFGMSREGGTMKQSKDGAIWVNYAPREWYFRNEAKKDATVFKSNDFKCICFKADQDAPIVIPNEPVKRYIEPANIYLNWKAQDKWGLTPEAHIQYSWRRNNGTWSDYTNTKELLLLDQKKGSYHFEIKARDSVGNVSAPITFAHVSITPPIWKEPWFIGSTSLVLVGFIILIVLFERMKVKQIVAFEEFKIQFFTNMSHELRTPLTVILGPLQRLLDNLPHHKERKSLELAYRNAHRMNQIVDQILDFRKAEFGKSKPANFDGDVIITISNGIELIKPLADAKKQILSFHSNKDHYMACYDADKLEKIVNNLVSNAIKYTQQDGSIHVRLRIQKTSEKTTELSIVVEDDGVGIPKKRLKQIFKPFYRVRTEDVADVNGTGLGLPLTELLVKECCGNIDVQSPTTIIDNKKRGTRFTVTIPLHPIQNQSKSNERDMDKKLALTKSGYDDEFKEEDNRPCILLIEDDTDILEYLQLELDDYRLKIANNGNEGLKSAKEFVPDLIISDVLMPGINGMQLCEKVKKDTLLCHIPLIFLTALKGSDHEAEGLDHGADDYITKPIDIKIFKGRIHAILQNRQRLHERYSNQIIEPNFEITSIADGEDQQILKQANQLVLENLDNPLFDIQLLSDELKMSRMTLYRKFKALTGESPSHFVRTIRLKKAATLLLTQEHTITDVSEKVGIFGSGQFSAAFKKMYGCKPSQYGKSKI